MRRETRRAGADPARARELLLERVVRLGTQGLSRAWLTRHGWECYGDWPAAVDELIDSGLIERRTVYRWGMAPAGEPKTIAYFPRHAGAGE